MRNVNFNLNRARCISNTTGVVEPTGFMLKRVRFFALHGASLPPETTQNFKAPIKLRTAGAEEMGMNRSSRLVVILAVGLTAVVGTAA